MRVVGARFKFGVELAAQIERGGTNLNHFHQSAVGRGSAKSKSFFGKRGAVIVVEFVTVTVTFGTKGFAVSLERL